MRRPANTAAAERFEAQRARGIGTNYEFSFIRSIVTHPPCAHPHSNATCRVSHVHVCPVVGP